MITSYDAAIVGSGPTGGYAAKVLSEAGLRVLVLDAGPGSLERRLRFRADALRRSLGYRIEHDPAAIRRQRIQSGCYAWHEHPHAFVDDLDQPYTTEPGRLFTWLRARHLGGRMIVRGHGLQFYRFSDLDFQAGRDGASPCWPMSYADLAPFYDRVERWMGLRGTPEGLAHLPDGVFAHSTSLDSGAKQLKAAIEGRWPDRRLIACRTASPPLPILDAMASGRCVIRSNAVVRHLTVDASTAKVSGVAFLDRRSGRAREVGAKAVVLCASAIESARILLLSATRQHPDGLGNSSGVLGRYLMDHTHLGGVDAVMPMAARVAQNGSSWSYIPRFRNVTDSRSDFLRGYGIQVFTRNDQCGLTAFGEMLPDADNRVTLDPHVVDRWGVPVPRLSCAHGSNEQAMVSDQMDACVEMLESAGCEIWRIRRQLSAPGLANHEMGTARMGSDPRTSVLNAFCQSWDVRNLFVMDGSCFVSQGVQNPTLTMLAIAARSSEYLVEEFRRGAL